MSKDFISVNIDQSYLHFCQLSVSLTELEYVTSALTTFTEPNAMCLFDNLLLKFGSQYDCLNTGSGVVNLFECPIHLYC